MAEYHGLYKRLGTYPYDQDPLRPAGRRSFRTSRGPDPAMTACRLSRASRWGRTRITSSRLREEALISRLTSILFGGGLALVGTSPAGGEDGYDLWLRYRLVADVARLAEYRTAIQRLVVQGDSPTLRAAHDELVTGLTGLLGRAPALGHRRHRAAR